MVAPLYSASVRLQANANLREDNAITLCNSCQAKPPIKFYQGLASSEYQLFRENITHSTPESLEIVVQDITWLDVEIWRLKDTVEKLEQQRLNARKHRDLILASFAPINRAPTEVLAEIFNLYCEDEILDMPLMGYTHPADLLSIVCFRWKNTVENTPKLWSRISVASTRQTFVPRVLTRCLTLSRKAPLHIDALTAMSQVWYSPAIIHNIELRLEAALQHSDRWESVSMDLVPQTTPVFTKYLRGSSKSQEDLFPLLRMINIFSPDLYISQDQSSLPFRRASLPHLNEFSVSCQNASRPHGLGSKLLVDPEITCLEVCGQFYDKDLIILNELTSIKQLNLRQYVGSRGLPTDDKIYSSSSLRHLVIRVHIRLLTSVNLTLFSHLTLPALTSLEISQFGTSQDEAVWNPSSFISMIQDCPCMLRSLYLEEIQIGFEDLTTLLRAMTTLENLTFLEHNKNKAKPSNVGFNLAVLLVWRTFSPLLPRLKDLELRVYSALDNVLLDVIRDLIVSRTSSSGTDSLLCEHLTYFRYHPLFGTAETLDDDPDLVMCSMEERAKVNVPSGVSFRVVLPPEEASQSELDDCNAEGDSIWSDDSSVVITEDSDYDRRPWEDEYPSDRSDIAAEEAGESEILAFDSNVSGDGEILIEQYYRALT
ncbi:hypothetical protein K435DRAFT_419629 [Dendrothele bispora CBS 962.96]|uniref:F-box domain-containing protein n=1 Tax=Dendrothele bispora (strain CBS 962.96) TaxID=1314807 RepID=A0A4V4HCL7_DENBC|nr:hypothetical protein K435DRAFT_419629 [Dendrothele bispora CBS 962.96]